MKNSFLSACLLVLVAILVNIHVAHAQPKQIGSSWGGEVKYVNGYKVAIGERPAIDIESVPTNAYEPGQIFIKISPSTKAKLTNETKLNASKGIVKTGIERLDKINSEFGASAYKPLLSSLYKYDANTKGQQSKHDAWEFNLWYVVTLNSEADIKKAVKDYMAIDEVLTAEPVYKKRRIEPLNVTPVHPQTGTKASPNDELYSMQWGFKNTGQSIRDQFGTPGVDINLEQAWTIERGNPKVIVSIHDGGVRYGHPDLAASMWSEIGPDGKATAADDHGTHVAGTIAAVTNNTIGVAGIASGYGQGDGVRLLTIDIFNGMLSTYDGYVYAADRGVPISQNSWGYKEANVYNSPDLLGIDYFDENGGGDAIQGGGLVIFAAGNDNDSGNWYPGCYSKTLAVASNDNMGYKSSFSNYGSWVHVTAPGTNIGSTGLEYDYLWMSGTSMACPHVSGIAALVASHYYGEITKTQLWDAIVSGVDDVYSTNSSYANQLGSGRANAYKALMAIPTTLPKAAIQTLQYVSDSDVRLGVNVTREGASAITSSGMVWGTTPSPTIASNQGSHQGTPTLGSYEVAINNLQPNTRYYARAYVTNSNGTYYTPNFEFSSPKTVSFVVVNSQKEPIANATVRVDGTDYTTNASGQASLSKVLGNYTYTVTAVGYITTMGSFIVGGGEPIVKLILIQDTPNAISPIGEQNVCVGSEVIYTIDSQSNGQWEIEGGELVSGSASSKSIVVKWLSSASGTLRYRIVDSESYQTAYSRAILINQKYTIDETKRPAIHKKGAIPILICTTPSQTTYTWYKDGYKLSGVNTQHFAPRNQSGNYQVQIMDGNFCPNTSLAVANSDASQSSSPLTVYPNPSNGQFKVVYSIEMKEQGVLEVYNGQGQVVHSEVIPANIGEFEKTVSIPNAPNGIYVVKLTTGDQSPASTRVSIF